MNRIHALALAQVLAVVSLATGLAACSSSDGTDTSNQPVDGSKQGFCATEDDAPQFTSGMSMMGGSNAFEVVMVNATPTLPIEGRNSWTVEVKDAVSGDPVEGATLTLTCAMPGHTHGCAVTPTVTDLGGGQYKIEPVIFNMPKRWNVSFNVKSPDGETTDHALLGVCI